MNKRQIMEALLAGFEKAGLTPEQADAMIEAFCDTHRMLDEDFDPARFTKALWARAEAHKEKEEAEA